MGIKYPCLFRHTGVLRSSYFFTVSACEVRVYVRINQKFCGIYYINRLSEQAADATYVTQTHQGGQNR